MISIIVGGCACAMIAPQYSSARVILSETTMTIPHTPEHATGGLAPTARAREVRCGLDEWYRRTNGGDETAGYPQDISVASDETRWEECIGLGAHTHYKDGSARRRSTT